MKAAIKCHETGDWVDTLPVVLLGIRTAIKENLKTLAAEIVYGRGIRLPGEFFTSNVTTTHSEFVKELQENIKRVKPTSGTRHGSKKTFIFKKLESSPQVFFRHDAVRGPLQPPYDGPFKVIERKDKTFKIDINGTKTTVSIDRVKPAFILSEDIDLPTTEPTEIRRNDSDETVQKKTQPADTVRTRYGRHVRFPDRFQAGL